MSYTQHVYVFTCILYLPVAKPSSYTFIHTISRDQSTRHRADFVCVRPMLRTNVADAMAPRGRQRRDSRARVCVRVSLLLLYPFLYQVGTHTNRTPRAADDQTKSLASPRPEFTSGGIQTAGPEHSTEKIRAVPRLHLQMCTVRLMA